MRTPAGWVRRALVLTLVACVRGDSPSQDDRPPAPRAESPRGVSPSEPRLAEHLLPVSMPRSVPELDTLIASLATLPGEITAEWEFKGDHRTFAAILALSDSSLALADTAVRRLVDCMGRTDPSAVTFEGRAVPVGIVCHRVMNWLAYHEEAGPDGGLVADWPGSVPVSASADVLKAAQRAWREVVRQRTYSFL